MLNCGHGRVGRFWTNRLSEEWVVVEKLVGVGEKRSGKSQKRNNTVVV